MPLGEGIAKRQLHFFFVCDCSGSMAYDGKIQALNQAIREATPEMQKVAAENPNAAVLVRLLIFSDDAVWHVAKPTPLEQFRLDNDLVAGGFTRLDRALDRLTEALSDPHLPERQLRPVILLVSDGQPSERWEKNLEALVATTWGGKAIRLAVGIGQDKDRDMLRKFIGNVETDILEADSPQALVDRIKWASTQAMSVSSKSKAVNMSPIIAQAQCDLARMYMDGEGVTQSYPEAFLWLRKAAEQGYARGQNGLGYLYLHGLGGGQDYEEALRWFRKAVGQGYHKAQCNLGWMYRNGLGVVQDYAEAARWFRKSAGQGDRTAQCNIGWRYQYGTGVVQDSAEAANWFRKAAEQGDAASQCNLGIMFYNGDGVEKDYGEARRWCGKAAEQGNALALRVLGALFASGLGVSRDIDTAKYYYQKAIAAGDAEAAQVLQRLG